MASENTKITTKLVGDFLAKASIAQLKTILARMEYDKLDSVVGLVAEVKTLKKEQKKQQILKAKKAAEEKHRKEMEAIEKELALLNKQA